MTRITLPLAPLALIVLSSFLPLTEAAAPAASAHKDLHRDDLPPGAVARGGTVRFRHASSAIAISPDGKILASGGHDNQIRLFDASTGKELRRLAGHQARTYAPEFDPRSVLDTLVSAVGSGFVCSGPFPPHGTPLAAGTTACGCGTSTPASRSPRSMRTRRWSRKWPIRPTASFWPHAAGWTAWPSCGIRRRALSCTSSPACPPSTPGVSTTTPPW